MATCETCGAAVLDPADRFCGGDRCLRVLMPRHDARDPAARTDSEPTR